ncbi:putative iron-sulfur cluster-binding metallochaperone [Methyloglobulus sp.]|uniref:putative iron-sulfur cluster-binding metallochaperone n=1 Tax=Methyloglobulus sp. TaxID=2518622 RepID=UPI00398A22F5
MSNCCPGSHPKPATQACPQCGTACKSVEMPTLYHQVRFPENQGINPDTYYFCPAKDCATGYFSTAGNNTPKLHLRTYQEIQKDTLCYCFDIDASDYLTALNTNHAEAIKNFVMHRTKSGECACELRNPSGQCCLARFKHLEKEHSK